MLGIGDLLELIHIDIYGHFTPPTLGGYRFFITFIDDFSRDGYVELIREKYDALVTFNDFKVRMELQMNKKLKVVRSHKGGKYYGRYDECVRNPRPFAMYL